MFADKDAMLNVPPKEPQSLEERFPNTYAMFIYHVTKAQLRLRAPDDREETWSAREQAEYEWSGINMQTESEWAELRYRLVEKGDKSYLRSASAAHLCKRGRARNVKTEGMGLSQRWRLKPWMDNPWSSDSEADDDDEATAPRVQDSDEPQFRPLTKSIFRPVKHKYRKVRRRQRTVCIRIPTGPDINIRPFQVADACRATMGSIQNSICEDAEILQPDLCLVRFRPRGMAQKIVGKTIRVATKEVTHELRAWPYPSKRSQVFVAQVAHHDPNGIRIDSVHAGVVDAISHVRFHVRFCVFEDEMRCVLVLAFEEPLKYMTFSVGVQTLRGSHHLAHFEPATRRRPCPVCKGSDHGVIDCEWLNELSWGEMPDSMRDGRYLDDPPEMV